MKLGKILASPVTQALITLALSQLQEVITKAAVKAQRREEQRMPRSSVVTDMDNLA